MDSIFFLGFASLGILYGVYVRHRMQSRQLRSMQNRLEIQNPEIIYDYNKFNTKKERTTTIVNESGNLNFHTDIQTIQIANGTLVSKVSSIYNEVPLVFDVVVQPFEESLFDMEGFRNFNQDGIVIIGTYGKGTRVGVDQIEELASLSDRIPDEPKAIYLLLDSFNVDKSENKVNLFGTYSDNNEFAITIDHKNYRLQFKTPLESLHKINNFKEFVAK